MALTGHSGMHTAQSMHSSGSIDSMFGPSRKQSTGQTSTQSVYLHLMHDSTTTCVIHRLPGSVSCNAQTAILASQFQCPRLFESIMTTRRQLLVATAAATTASGFGFSARSQSVPIRIGEINSY